MTTPRGLRNNNPLNIEKTKGGNPWQGEIIPSADPRFAQFKSIAHGYRAAFKLLNNYQRNYGLNTIREMITRWAPPKEKKNNTEAYIEAVSEQSGIPANKRIDSTDHGTMVPIVAAMSKVENGVSANIADVEAGWHLFTNK